MLLLLGEDDISEEINQILRDESVSKGEKILNLLARVVKDVADLKATSKDYNSRLNPIEEDVPTLKKEIIDLKTEIVNLKRSERSNNLIIFKLPDDEENNNNLCTFISKKLKYINSEINTEAIASVMRISVYKTNNCRPVLVRFYSPQFKTLIFRNMDKVRKLKLAVSNDLSPVERAVRKTLLDLVLKLKRQGYKDAKIRGNDIQVGDQIYTANEVNRHLEESK